LRNRCGVQQTYSRTRPIRAKQATLRSTALRYMSRRILRMQPTAPPSRVMNSRHFTGSPPRLSKRTQYSRAEPCTAASVTRSCPSRGQVQACRTPTQHVYFTPGLLSQLLRRRGLLPCARFRREHVQQRSGPRGRSGLAHRLHSLLLIMMGKLSRIMLALVMADVADHGAHS